MLDVKRTSSAERVAHVLNANESSPAIVLGGQVSGLAAVRSLGRRDVPVAVIDPDEQALARSSRYALAGAAVSSPLDDEAATVAWLRELGDALERPAVLFPTGDDWALAVARSAAALGDGFAAPPVGEEVVARVLDKGRLHTAALEAGVPVPRLAPYDVWRLDEAERTIGYPCVVKPALKGDFVRRFGQAGRLASSEEELAAIVEEADRREMVLQELLPIEDAVLHTAAVYIDRRGRLAGAFGGRRLAVHPPMFGTTCLVESRPEPTLVGRAVRLLGELGYRGIAEVEFIWDPSDEEWKLIDINPRCWKWVGLTAFGGVDLVWMAYQDATGQPIDAAEQVPGRRWASLLDLASLRAETGRSPLDDGECQALMSGQVDACLVDSVMAMDDPLPFMRALESMARPATVACKC
jgi:D-aspartate ligase